MKTVQFVIALAMTAPLFGAATPTASAAVLDLCATNLYCTMEITCSTGAAEEEPEAYPEAEPEDQMYTSKCTVWTEATGRMSLSQTCAASSVICPPARYDESGLPHCPPGNPLCAGDAGFEQGTPIGIVYARASYRAGEDENGIVDDAAKNESGIK